MRPGITHQLPYSRKFSGIGHSEAFRSLISCIAEYLATPNSLACALVKFAGLIFVEACESAKTAKMNTSKIFGYDIPSSIIDSIYFVLFSPPQWYGVVYMKH